MTAMIDVQGFTKQYGDFTAVSGLSFTVQAGEVLGLVGPNGAGKTTTLRSIAGIIPPSIGRIRIAGHDLLADPIGAKRQLAFFPDEPRLFDYLTVRQHLAFVARLYGVIDHEAVARPLLEEFEIADKADTLPGELSRGMKQKLAIACGLLHSPSVMFFDEPLTGLDPLGIRRMKNSILQRARAGCRHRSQFAPAASAGRGLHACADSQTRSPNRSWHAGEVSAAFSSGESGVSLEEVFLRATGGSEG